MFSFHHKLNNAGLTENIDDYNMSFFLFNIYIRLYIKCDCQFHEQYQKITLKATMLRDGLAVYKSMSNEFNNVASSDKSLLKKIIFTLPLYKFL